MEVEVYEEHREGYPPVTATWNEEDGEITLDFAYDPPERFIMYADQWERIWANIVVACDNTAPPEHEPLEPGKLMELLNRPIAAEIPEN